MRRHALAATLSTLLLLTFAVGASAAGSGTIVDHDAAERTVRAERLLRGLAAEEESEAAWAAYEEGYFQKRADHRVSCRAELRQANRDTKLDVILRCSRGEWTMERELLRHQRIALDAVAGVSEEVRSEARHGLDLLRDALNTLIFAVDSDVYTSPEDVIAAKRKLQQAYRIPFEKAMNILRADRLLSWTDLLLTDEEASTAGSGATLGGTAKDCLLARDQELRTMLGGGTGSLLSRTIPHLRQCLQTGSGGTIPVP